MAKLDSYLDIHDSSCPNCGEELDSATAVGDHGAPRPGDVSVCIHCAAVLTFGESMQMIEANLTDFDGETREQLERSIAAVRAVRKVR